MTTPTGTEKITFLPLDQATEPNTGGIYELWRDCWWSHLPGRGLLLYRYAPRAAPSPQCNSNRAISERFTRELYASIWPEIEVIQVPRVYLPHRCEL
jgi:hypothetical protein